MRKSKVSDGGFRVRRSRGGWQVWQLGCMSRVPSYDGQYTRIYPIESVLEKGLTRSEAHAIADFKTSLYLFDQFDLFWH